MELGNNQGTVLTHCTLNFITTHVLNTTIKTITLHNLLLHSQMVHSICFIVLLILFVVKSIRLVEFTTFCPNAISLHGTQKCLWITHKIHLYWRKSLTMSLSLCLNFIYNVDKSNNNIKKQNFRLRFPKGGGGDWGTRWSHTRI